MGLNELLRQKRRGDWLGPRIEAARPFEIERWETPKRYVRPSASGGPCALEQQLELLGHRGAIDAALRAIMDAGNDVETRVRGYYTGAGLLRASNLRLWDYGEGYWVAAERSGGTYVEPVYAEPYAGCPPEGIDPGEEDVVWSGELDVLVADDAGKLYVGDIKKMNSHRKRKLPPLADDPSSNALALQRAEPKYAAQLFQYIEKVGATLGVEGEAFLHIEDANFNAYEIRWVCPTLEQIAWANERADRAAAASRLGILLEQPFPKSSKQCRACHKKRVCGLLRAGDQDTHALVMEQMREVVR